MSIRKLHSLGNLGVTIEKRHAWQHYAWHDMTSWHDSYCTHDSVMIAQIGPRQPKKRLHDDSVYTMTAGHDDSVYTMTYSVLEL